MLTHARRERAYDVHDPEHRPGRAMAAPVQIDAELGEYFES